MRNVIVLISTTAIGILVLFIVMTINGRMVRSMELSSNLSSVVEETLENMTLNPKYNIQNTNAFIADFVETLSMSIDANSDVAVDILQCDKERGILSVRVMSSYVHPNGDSGTISCEKHVILDKLPEIKGNQYRVVFYVGSEIYKEYVLTEGAVLAAPVPPIISDGTFAGWIDGSGVAADFTQSLIQDVVYYAVIS